MPFAALAAPDMGIYASGIRFSEPTLVAGDTIRIYATIKNEGDIDISGYVFFYKGSEPIGPSQIVSAASGGANEDVWADFVVPYGNFNIRAEIKGTDPADTNPANDVAITTLFSIVVDDDYDTVPNDRDNCVNTANTDQLDFDNDGMGDVCDDDDDNDGLTDAVEAELGTSPFNADTDGDGVGDAKDPAPLDPNITGNEPVVSAVVQADPVFDPVLTTTVSEAPVDDSLAKNDIPASEPTPDPASDLSADVDSDGLNASQEAVLGTDPNNSDTDGDGATDSKDAVPLDSNIQKANEIASNDLILVSTNASFVYSPIDWKTYSFRSLNPNDNIQVEWDFGDSSISQQSQVEHKFLKPGKYLVKLSVTDQAGNVKVDSEEIQISFFHLANPYVKVIIGGLGLLMFAFIALALKKGGSGKTAKNAKIIERSENVEEEDDEEDEIDSDIEDENTEDTVEDEDVIEEDEDSMVVDENEETEEEIAEDDEEIIDDESSESDLDIEDNKSESVEEESEDADPLESEADTEEETDDEEEGIEGLDSLDDDLEMDSDDEALDDTADSLEDKGLLEEGDLGEDELAQTEQKDLPDSDGLQKIASASAVTKKTSKKPAKKKIVKKTESKKPTKKPTSKRAKTQKPKNK